MNLLHLHYSDKKFKSCISNTIYFILKKKEAIRTFSDRLLLMNSQLTIF
jgi:hypothetical protein